MQIHRTNKVGSVSYSYLVQVFVKAVREIGEPEGSSLRYYSVLDRNGIFSFFSFCNFSNFTIFSGQWKNLLPVSMTLRWNR